MIFVAQLLLRIQWQGFSVDESTWESEDMFVERSLIDLVSAVISNSGDASVRSSRPYCIALKQATVNLKNLTDPGGKIDQDVFDEAFNAICRESNKLSEADKTCRSQNEQSLYVSVCVVSWKMIS